MTFHLTFGISLIYYQVNCAWTLDRTKSEWIDLGIHTDIFMTRPDTCDAAGGAISLWVKVIDCATSSGIVSSVNAPFHTDSAIICENQHIR